MEAGELRVLSTDGDAWILRLDAINAPDPDDAEGQVLKDAFASQMAGELGRAIAGAYTQALVDEAGVDINQAAVNAVLSHGGS
jgi:peptidyl-prolyl cis-trans isomerase D